MGHDIFWWWGDYPNQKKGGDRLGKYGAFPFFFVGVSGFTAGLFPSTALRTRDLTPMKRAVLPSGGPHPQPFH